MKKRIITLCLIMIGCILSSFGNDTDYKQALIDRLDTTTVDSMRLKILYDLTQQTKAQPEERTKYTDRMLKEAERQNNDKYRCEAYVSYMSMAYNRFDPDEVFKWMKLLEPLARKIKSNSLLFFGKQCYVDMLIVKEEYELQEKEALKMLKEATKLNYVEGMVAAYQSLAYGYQYTHRDEQALEVLEKAYRLGPQCSDKLLNSSILSTLINICERLQNTQKWLQYIRALEDCLKRLMEERPEFTVSLRSDLMQVYIHYLNYYTFTKNWPQATQASLTAKEYYSETYTSAHNQPYHEAQCKYFKKIGALDDALREVDAILTTMDTGFNVNYYSRLIYKAQILSLLGREQEAIPLYKKILKGKDSLQIEIINKQTRQIKENYNADKLLLEKEKIQRQTQLAFFIPLCLLIAFLISFVVHIYRIRGKLRKAKEEMGKMAADVEQANTAKEKFLSNISAAIRTPLDTIVSDSLLLSSDNVLNKAEKDRLSGIINNTSAELMNLINDILTLSKLEAGVLKYNPGELEICAFLRSMAEMESSKNGIPISAALPENTEYEVQVDLNYFSQMINSLFAATAEGCAEIGLSQEKTNSEQLQIIILGTRLASTKQSQEIMIRNEINRMLTEHFGGQYEIHADAEKPYISLTLPVSRTINL